MASTWNKIREHYTEGYTGIHALMDDLVSSLPLNRVHPAYGSAVPPMRSTVTHSPRIVTCLAGVNNMQFPQGDEIIELALHPGDAVFITERAWNKPLHTENHTFLTLDFKPELVRFYWMAVTTGDLRGSPRTAHMRNGRVGATGGHIIRAFEALAEQPSPCEESTKALAEALIRQAHTECTRPDQPHLEKGHATWQMLCQYVEDHLHEPIRREDLAAFGRLHPNHVSRLFRQRGHESFRSYLTRIRMERAAEFLRRYDLPIKEVAARCGFPEPGYFGNVFRRFFGMSPGQYRLRNPSM